MPEEMKKAWPEHYRYIDTIGPEGLEVHCIAYQVIGETAQCYYIGDKHTCDLVIVGTQFNHEFEIVCHDAGEFVLYLHEGARTAGGGRPWTPDGRADLVPAGSFGIAAGNDYNTQAYAYHRTEPGGDGRVATIMAKRGEYPAGAHSTCRFGITPDTDFDRFQWSRARLWEIVTDVLLGQQVAT